MVSILSPDEKDLVVTPIRVFKQQALSLGWRDDQSETPIWADGNCR
jgi:hypothetical protein